LSHIRAHTKIVKRVISPEVFFLENALFALFTDGATRNPEFCGPGFVPEALGQAQSTSLTTCSVLIKAGYGVV
jgi:hypothetical protein